VATNATLDTPDAQGAGDTVYIYFVNFANQGTVTRTIDMFAFTLVTTNGSSFAWRTVQEEQNPLGGSEPPLRKDSLRPGRFRGSAGPHAGEARLQLYAASQPGLLFYRQQPSSSHALGILVHPLRKCCSHRTERERPWYPGVPDR
jgi:hypothetical protein